MKGVGRRQRRIAFLALGLSLPAFSFQLSPVFAETKIAYVDLGRAFDDYEKTKRLDRQLEQRSGAKQAEREKIVTEIRRMRDELELMSEEGREGRQRGIDEKIRSLQEFDRQARESLRNERDEMVKTILKEIEQVIHTYAAKAGYTLVLSDRAVLHADKALDITEDILQQLNGQETGKAPRP